MAASDWSGLPLDLLELITELLLRIDIRDYVRFRAVCSAWRSAAPDLCDRTSPLPPQLPWLMLSFDENSDVRSFYRLSDGQVLSLALPEARDARIVGCAGGCLVLVDGASGIRLFNPLTKAQIYLPPPTTLPHLLFQPRYDHKWFICMEPVGEWCSKLSSAEVRDLFVDRVVLSTPHLHDLSSVVFMASFPLLDKLAFARAEDERWIVTTEMIGDCYDFTDILYYRGSVYAATSNGVVYTCDIGCPYRLIPITSETSSGKAYEWLLVESASGDLLVVARHRANLISSSDTSVFVRRTSKFEVFRLERTSSRKAELAEVESLGEQMLFLGTNRSVCLSARDFPQYKGNCIYFTTSYFSMQWTLRCSVWRLFHDDIPYDCSNDCGVFSLEDGSIKPLPFFQTNSDLLWPPPIWFTPTL